MNAQILRPALHTLWQSFLAAILMWWTAAGLIDIKAVHSIDDAKRFGLSLLLAVLAAVASAVLHTVKQYGSSLLSGNLDKHVDPYELQLIDKALDDALAHVPETVTPDQVQHAVSRLSGHPQPGPKSGA